MTGVPFSWYWPWFSWMVIPLVAGGFRRGFRGACGMAVISGLLAGLWLMEGCSWGWAAGPLVLLVLLTGWIYVLEQQFKQDSRALAQQEKGISEQVKGLRTKTEAARLQVQEREQQVHEISQLYELSKEFLATLEEPEALKIVEDSIARAFPQLRLSDREIYLQRIRALLARGGDLSAEDLIQAMPMAGSDFSLRDRWGIVGEQLALGLQRISLYRKVQESATHDGLTGLLVRRYFRERFEDEIIRAQRRSSPLAFLMVDLDHFKTVNDTYGHLVGDVVLREAASHIRACVREMDLLSRYGGEEFAIALPESGRALGLQVAERIRRLLEESRIRAYDEEVRITVSIGVSFYPEDGSSAEELVERADQALYCAKAQGRNRTVLASS